MAHDLWVVEVAGDVLHVQRPSTVEEIVCVGYQSERSKSRSISGIIRSPPALLNEVLLAFGADPSFL